MNGFSTVATQHAETINRRKYENEEGVQAEDERSSLAGETPCQHTPQRLRAVISTGTKQLRR